MKLQSLISLAAIGVQSVLAAAPAANYHAGYAAQYVKAVSPAQVVAGEFEGYFYANQYYFTVKDVMYIGFQPRNASKTNHLAFSVFGKGAYTDHPNCRYGADGPASAGGVSCSLDYPWKYKHNYTTEVVRTDYNDAGNNTWTGYLHDLETDERVEIGRFTTGPEHGLLSGDDYVFDENYSWSWLSTDVCIPYSEYIQYNPTFYDANGKSYPTTVDHKVANVQPNDKYSYDPCSLKHDSMNYNVTIYDDHVVFINGPYAPDAPN